MRLEPLQNSEDELKKTAQLFSRVWPHNRRLDAAYLRWLYTQNPNGKALGFNAYEGEDLLAHYAVTPHMAEIHGELKTSALSLNTAVDERVRGQGLFKKLAEKTYELAAGRGIDHVVGVANAQSTHGFVKSLGFQLVTGLDTRFVMGAPHFRDSVAPLDWRRRWTAGELKWRLSQPHAQYAMQKVDSVIQVTGQTKYAHVIGILKIEREAKLQAAISLPTSAARRPLLWFGKTPYWKHFLSLSMPVWLRPSPFNMIFRDLSGNSRKLSSQALHFEAADFDVL